MKRLFSHSAKTPLALIILFYNARVATFVLNLFSEKKSSH